MSKSEAESKIVVQGEASESDDDENDDLTAPQGVIVSGEASESDEEEIDLRSPTTPPRNDFPPLIVNQRSETTSEIPTLMSPRAAEAKATKPKYDTLLHRKLRESNLLLHSHIVDNCSQAYLSAARNLHTTTQQLQKSHASVQLVFRFI
ncbi:hypothetical protein LOTGIDRAFT_232286 [Lottia gigantea]|uniref:Biogenesis of lysosome-related organelles complex 1 subunit 3 n=1 Tax=Lottia gigantea TaxID=225164 RepID=V4AMP4_LOTGI|nr:hypothetical protein LOTGIDRAFT_232286 [Lottia gigantea]ESO94866.1 hypothetical protein LOTGIDRAFT_232286 [Lottia gigantea]